MGLAKCLRLLTGGDGGGSNIHKTCLRNTWMFPYRLILHTKDIHDVECTMINSNPKGKLTLKNLNEGRKWTVLKSMFEKYVELSEQ